MDISLKYDLLRNEAANGYRRQFYDAYMAPLSIKQNSCQVCQVAVFMHLTASSWKITISNVKFADKRPSPALSTSVKNLRKAHPVEHYIVRYYRE